MLKSPIFFPKMQNDPAPSSRSSNQRGCRPHDPPPPRPRFPMWPDGGESVFPEHLSRYFLKNFDSFCLLTPSQKDKGVPPSMTRPTLTPPPGGVEKKKLVSSPEPEVQRKAMLSGQYSPWPMERFFMHLVENGFEHGKSQSSAVACSWCWHLLVTSFCQFLWWCK